MRCQCFDGYDTGSFTPLMDSFKDQWYQQQVDHISDALQELLTDDDPSIAIKGLSDAIASWEDYHEKELAKWKRLRALLNWEAGT